MSNKEANNYLRELRKFQEERDVPIGLSNYGHLADWDFKLRVKVSTDEDDGDEMLEILEGTSTKPVGSEAEIKAWVKMDRKVKKILLGKVDKTLYHVVTGPGHTSGDSCGSRWRRLGQFAGANEGI
ncbi:hypothetical protein BJ741DRAFT_574603 [Chytriomyces cf. hyalinus JEL632]|nr:hypothetical protein BJ741DRAFT_574603 [Chytriomyces cf. hyalinus JEL632]